MRTKLSATVLLLTGAALAQGSIPQPVTGKYFAGGDHFPGKQTAEVDTR